MRKGANGLDPPRPCSLPLLEGGRIIESRFKAAASLSRDLSSGLSYVSGPATPVGGDAAGSHSSDHRVVLLRSLLHQFIYPASHGVVRRKLCHCTNSKTLPYRRQTKEVDMAVQRSPNYPQMDLKAALEAVIPAYKAEGRNKMSRLVLASHLGYSSLNGRALAKIGAVRAYGLIDGREDDIRISNDAITYIEAPEGAPERAEAIARCAVKPPVFKEIYSEYPTLPSEANLRFALIQRGYAPDAASKAAQNYLATMLLVEASGGAYPAASSAQQEASPMQAAEIEPNPAQRVAPIRDTSEPIAGGEREWLRGPLSREVSYRLIVDGDMGPKQIGKLIKLLEAQKAVLDDDDDEYGGL